MQPFRKDPLPRKAAGQVWSAPTEERQMTTAQKTDLSHITITISINTAVKPTWGVPTGLNICACVHTLMILTAFVISVEYVYVTRLLRSIHFQFL